MTLKLDIYEYVYHNFDYTGMFNPSFVILVFSKFKKNTKPSITMLPHLINKIRKMSVLVTNDIIIKIIHYIKTLLVQTQSNLKTLILIKLNKSNTL